ncbi:hypothetical protein [Pseudonocardia sp.]|uniref:hypothetical protein n=1 Tax=Pseudonocardia sp. TaxID=60912 RepID=UPI003D0FE894
MPRIEPDDPPEATAAVLRERIYGGIACLSTLLVLARHVEDVESAWTAFADVAIATGALYAASLLADYVAHVAAHGQGPRGADAVAALRASGQILQASAVPLLLLALAGVGIIGTAGALRAGVWVSVVTLGLFALLAARRTMLPWWQRAVLVAALLGLGALVVALKTLAH